MISPLTQQTLDEVMTEFDQVFSGLFLKTQKPTTYRKDERGNVFIILLPSNLRISQILETLGSPLGERYLLILSHFYVRGLLKKKTANRLGNFLSIHRDVLRKLGGESYPKLLQYGLAENHLVKSPKQFVIGKSSNEYRLNGDVLSLKTQQRYELKTVRAIQVRTQHANERKTAFIKKGPTYQKIADSIDRLTFDYSAAIKYVAGLPDGETKTHRKNVVEQFMLDDPIWAIDRQGRNYTVMVSVPRDLRRFFSYGKQTLYVLDISSSQPLLHLLLYPTECDEQKRYQSLVQSGKFWEFINDAAGKPFDLSDDDEKAELKESVYQQVFFSYREPKKGVTREFAVIFKREFPVLWSEINCTKTATGSKQSGPLAKVMQQTEAEVVAAAIHSLKDKPYPLITIHDAVVTTKDGLADVEQALKKSFVAFNLSPALAVKKLTA